MICLYNNIIANNPRTLIQNAGIFHFFKLSLAGFNSIQSGVGGLNPLISRYWKIKKNYTDDARNDATALKPIYFFFFAFAGFIAGLVLLICGWEQIRLGRTRLRFQFGCAAFIIGILCAIICGVIFFEPD